jgi:uncharacterized protein YqjF (DUF2071 family)
MTEHRPWPLPSGLWVMKHIRHDLVFAHWPVSNDILRARVPPVLTLDTLGGQAWVAVTPFRMSGIRAAGLPALPGLSRFPELNLRTYVTYGGKPGVYFFSFDAANLPAVWAARALYHLPYFHAAIVALAGCPRGFHGQHNGTGSWYRAPEDRCAAVFCSQAGNSPMAAAPSLGPFLSPGDALRAAYNSRFSAPEENP